eukprot:COSAG01_NODE_419_length_17278_cov_34.763432_6_plen_242_part_00
MFAAFENDSSSDDDSGSSCGSEHSSRAATSAPEHARPRPAAKSAPTLNRAGLPPTAPRTPLPGDVQFGEEEIEWASQELALRFADSGRAPARRGAAAKKDRKKLAKERRRAAQRAGTAASQSEPPPALLGSRDDFDGGDGVAVVQHGSSDVENRLRDSSGAESELSCAQFRAKHDVSISVFDPATDRRISAEPLLTPVRTFHVRTYRMFVSCALPAKLVLAAAVCVSFPVHHHDEARACRN